MTMPNQRSALIAGDEWELGRELALRFAARGMRIALAGPEGGALDQVAADPACAPAIAAVAVADLADEAGATGAVARSRAALGAPIEVLVTLGGPETPHRRLWDIAPDEFDAAMGADLLAPFLLAKSVLPGMIERGHGRIVNIGSIDGHRGGEAQSARAAAKWALRGLTRSSAIEAGEHGITINLVSPGTLAGERAERNLADRARFRGRSVEQERADSLRRAARRQPGTVADVAEAVMFLISDGARHITGQELVVDGGAVV